MPWDLSFNAIWPIVQLIIEPFGTMIGITVAVVMVGLVLGVLLKRLGG